MYNKLLVSYFLIVLRKKTQGPHFNGKPNQKLSEKLQFKSTCQPLQGSDI